MRLRRRTLRAGLVVLAVAEAGVGIWQLLLPRSFFDLPWVAYLPPYNEHLMTDVGGLNLAMAAILVASSISLDHRQVFAALSGYLVWSSIHLVIHAQHLDDLPTTDAIGLTVANAIGVIAPLGLVLVNRAVGSSADRFTTP